MFFADSINKNNKMDIKDIKRFLEKFNVKYDFPEKTFVIRDKGEIISAGSLDNNVMKYFFTSCQHKGEGSIATIYKSLLNYLIEKDRASFFVFTSPNNKAIFSSLGLSLVYETDQVVLLEGGFSNYKAWIKSVKDSLKIEEELDKQGKLQIKTSKKKYIRGSIVMNCNPMTLGHLYLIEKALEQVEQLLIFVVEEDQSVFSFEDRWNIMNEEFKNNKRIKLIPSGPYIISKATFPTYFLKEEDDKLDVYTRLDAGIFGEKIAKDLEIGVRFLGTEPKDLVTRAYNKNIKKVFESLNIEVKVFDRKEIEGKIISASNVRNLLSQGKTKEAHSLLPHATIDFLKSEKGKKTIDKLINPKTNQN